MWRGRKLPQEDRQKMRVVRAGVVAMETDRT